MTDEGLAERDGVEAKAMVVEQLARALEIIRQHNPARIATLGGECSVSVAPFSALADRYGDDLAIVWIDSHPDVGTGDSEYPAITRWQSPRSPGTATRRCRRCFPRSSHLTESPWWGSILGPTTTIRTLPSGAFNLSALTSCGSRVPRSWIGSPAPAVPAPLSTSTSTPSTATRLCSASAPNLAA